MSRDLLNIRRGMRVSLPILTQGEPGFTIDEERLYIGGLGGNVGVAMKKELDAYKAEKATEIINVKYPPTPLVGAKGDYNPATGLGTDDTTNIQAIAENYVGCELFFPDGNYLITQPVIMSDPNSTDNFRPVTKLRGSGIGKSKIYSNVMGIDKAVFEWNQSVSQSIAYNFGIGAFIQDIELVGISGNTANGVKLEGLFFPVLDRVYIHGMGNNGVYMPYDITLENPNDDAYATVYTSIRHSFIQENGGCGIYGDKLSTTAIIENSHITDNKEWGVRLSTRELKIFRNAISNNGIGDDVTRYGGMIIERASSILSGALPHSSIFEVNEFDGNWGCDIDLYSCAYSDLSCCMFIPRAIDKAVIPNIFKAPIAIKIGGKGNSEGVYNTINKPVFRITDFDNGGNSANDPDYTCVKIENINYGNKIVEPLFYGGASSKLTRISDVSGYQNEWIEKGLWKHRSGSTLIKPYVVARQPNPTTIANNIITKLTWASEQSNKYSMFDMATGTLTMPFGGVVSVKGFITLLAPVVDKDISIYVYFNGSAYKRIFYRTLGAANECLQFDFGLLELSTAGTIDIRVYQSTGVDLLLDGANGQLSNLAISID